MGVTVFIPSAPLFFSRHSLPSVSKRLLGNYATHRRTKLIPIRMSQDPHPTPEPSAVQELLWRAPPAIAYILYMNHIFFQSPTGTLAFQSTFKEALELSLNFCYITPLLQPQIAPVMHPMLEALFHLVVSWALLLFGFMSEDNPPRSRLPSASFVFIAASFFTNIIYLPYLVFREKPKGELQKPLNAIQKLGESIYLPIFCVALTFVSSLWALFARPEFGDFGTRFTSFKNVFFSDILAYSFGIDTITFSIFQSWLVRDDANRRVWKDDSIKSLALNTSILPFFGLAFYLVQRARNSSYGK